MVASTLFSHSAIGYIRVSTDEQKSTGISLKAQKSNIEAYCQLNNLVLAEIIEDAGIGGKNLSRPGMLSLLEKIKDPAISNIVVVKIDRLTRSTKDLLYLIDECFKHENVQFHSIQEKIDSSSAQGRFFLTVIGALATMEREMISERTKEALQYKKKTGTHLGQVPYGFMLSNGRLNKNHENIKILEDISSLRKKGYSYQKISNYLNSNQINPKKALYWNKSSVWKTLKYYDNWKKLEC
jgi:DNA invertase Pin-like site-specific DNA recombinase